MGQVRIKCVCLVVEEHKRNRIKATCAKALRRRSKDCERSDFRDSKASGMASGKIGELKILKSSRLSSLRPDIRFPPIMRSFRHHRLREERSQDPLRRLRWYVFPLRTQGEYRTRVGGALGKLRISSIAQAVIKPELELIQH
ncbi:hypothetical protein EVAR_31834_1 [Eumeta japonica]|uniref:Uncharacterized protein n=1 Tax=Eumeta variegata TaxID=151549 RepID=A0A4C1WJT7_EUMVA|nr:hypothetical protein EVAR_31834_1 [Eumeta japonica]